MKSASFKMIIFTFLKNRKRKYIYKMKMPISNRDPKVNVTIGATGFIVYKKVGANCNRIMTTFVRPVSYDYMCLIRFN